MSRPIATQRSTSWANLHDPLDGALAGQVAEEFDPALLTPPLHLVPLDPATAQVRSTALLQGAHEVGTWSLEYLGPGFHVQLRIVRHHRQARLDGWMSPARPITVLLASLLRKPVILETRVSDSGRFEFPFAPTGACRMSFVIDEGGRSPATPPFWV